MKISIYSCYNLNWFQPYSWLIPYTIFYIFVDFRFLNSKFQCFGFFHNGHRSLLNLLNYIGIPSISFMTNEQYFKCYYCGVLYFKKLWYHLLYWKNTLITNLLCMSVRKQRQNHEHKGICNSNIAQLIMPTCINEKKWFWLVS